jgi:hypothetical protein
VDNPPQELAGEIAFCQGDTPIIFVIRATFLLGLPKQSGKDK